MALFSEVDDQTYQFFIEEVPELLQTIETNLLTLKTERSDNKIHELMRSAHSIKGGAAFVELGGIVDIAHRLEDIFRALHDDSVEIDTDLEGLLLQAYDCLQAPLMEQIKTRSYDAEGAIAAADPIFIQLETRLSDALSQAEYQLPGFDDSGVDIVSSIFESDVANGLAQIEKILGSGDDPEEIAKVVRTQVEVFIGFAEFLNLPGFESIAQTALAALDTCPDQVLQTAKLALADFQSSQAAVLAGDRVQGGSPSEALMSIAQPTPTMQSAQSPQPAQPAQLSQSAPPTTIAAAAEMSAMANIVADEEPMIIFDPSSFSQEPMPVAGDDIPPLSLEDLLNGTPTPAETLDSNPEPLFGAKELEVASYLEEEAKELEAASYLEEPKAVEVAPYVEEPKALEVMPSEEPKVLEVVSSEEPKVLEAELSLKEPEVRKPLTPQLSTNIGQPLASPSPVSNISVRVDLDRLERMNNALGELAVNRSTFALEYEQTQEAISELLQRLDNFHQVVERLQTLSDSLLFAEEQAGYSRGALERHRSPASEVSSLSADTNTVQTTAPRNTATDLLVPNSATSLAAFDSLEMDRYSKLHTRLQEVAEEAAQIEEVAQDVALFSGRSNRVIRQERQILSNLREDLMRSRMLAISEVLNRFPRVLRELSTTHQKSVELKLVGTEVQVERAILEKLYDPLLHLVRNAFDHGIESPDVRQKAGKPRQGEIQIRAYHQNNQTVVEIQDDGKGLDVERIRARAIEKALISLEEMENTSCAELLEVIFEPGFSTASQVSDLSGRGVGLDIVREQILSLKGSIAVASTPGEGAIFTLRLPFTLTITKLMVCSVGTTTIALPTESIFRVITPQADQVYQTGDERFLTWHKQSIPIYRLADLLNYRYPLPDALDAVVIPRSSEEKEARPLLMVEGERGNFVLEADRLLAEQELMVKPFGMMVTPPDYIFGCTTLGNGSLIPVINGKLLLEAFLRKSPTHEITRLSTKNPFLTREPEEKNGKGVSEDPISKAAPVVLVVDDSATVRRALVQTLQKIGYPVLQARDGCEALEQLRRNSDVQLIICDVEMPNMNGFTFLDNRRQDPKLAAIPVVMLSTRSNSKHRSLSKHLGANDYFTKPYIELEFVSAIKQIIEKSATEGAQNA